tara:strand:+ start:92 stop:544 length:453 start_codon:yes stop_codon:yes gene_type:complete
MKKLLGIVVLNLLFSGSAIAEDIKKIHFICEFDRYLEINGFDEKQIDKKILPSAVTEDEFITIGITPNNEILILETSYWGVSSLYEPEERIIIPYSITDKEIKFDIPGRSNGVEHYYTLNRRSGKLEMFFKNSVSNSKMYSSCSIKEKIF